MRSKKFKRWLCGLLCLCMAFAQLPVAVWAGESLEIVSAEELAFSVEYGTAGEDVLAMLPDRVIATVSDPTAVRYEAENAAVTSPARVFDGGTSSGGKHVGAIDNANASVVFTVNAPTAGEYQMNITYSGHVDYPNTSHKYTVNGANEQTVTYSERKDWSDWYVHSVFVELTQGTNTIAFYHSGIENSFAQLDCIDLAPGQLLTGGDVEIPVTGWSCADFDPQTPGVYTFTGILGGDHQNPKGLQAVARVTVKQDPASIVTTSSVPFSQVTVEDEFWTARQKQIVCEVIPVAIERVSTETGGMLNFQKAAEYLSGKEGAYTTTDAPAHGGMFFVDSDDYKVIEAMSYALQLDPHGDEEMIAGQQAIREQLEVWIPWIVGAQEADGYLNTAATLSGGIGMRFNGRTDDMPVRTDGSLYDTVGTSAYVANFDLHELYCAGHFYEAAVAHYRATGDFRLLDVAVKNADLVVRTFGYGEDQVQAVPGHQEIELALIKLAELCSEIGVANGVDYGSKAAGYIEKAKFFLDERGHTHDGTGSMYSFQIQDHAPVADQRTATGHCVRAQYMYTAMADVALMELAKGETNPYDEALLSIWADARTKQYITGGVGLYNGGSAGGVEAFSAAYELPNDSAYCETCATISNAMWNQRMNLLYGDSKYADQIERNLYNGILSCLNLDGDQFFYSNPMQSDNGSLRSDWFGTACCPPNLLRTVTSIGGYIYTQDSTGGITVNQYIGNTAGIDVNGTAVTLRLEAGMPWNGEATLTVETPVETSIRFRVPEWATHGNTVKVNGEAVSAEADENGYVVIHRGWAAGDTVELSFPMEAERIYSDEQVTTNAGLVAVRRGPVIYCAETADNAGVEISGIVLPEDAAFTVGELTRLAGREGEDSYNVENVVPISFRGSVSGLFTSQDSVDVTMIPYYAWGNRGTTAMRVYLRESVEGVTGPLESYASVSASFTFHADNIDHLNDGVNDNAVRNRWTAYDSPTTHNWVQYAFDGGCVTLRGVWVTWYDDGGGVKVPDGLRIEYWDGTQWQEVSGMTNADQFPAGAEQYYGFDEIVTNKIRLYPTNSAATQQAAQPGIQEWRLDGEVAQGIQFAETVRYEAEDAAVTAPAAVSNVTVASGGKYVGGIDNENATVTFTVNAEQAGVYRMVLTYSGSTLYPNTAHKYYVNGDAENAAIISYDRKVNWNDWFHGAVTIELEQGENTITVTHAGIENSFAQLDCIELTLVEPAVEVPVMAFGYSGDLTWELNEEGVLTFFGEGRMRNYGTRYEVPWNEYRADVTSIVIPEGATRISALTFVDMINLEAVQIPATVTEIGAYAFKNCAKLTNVVLPEGLTKLGDSAFYGCAGLTEVVIPAGVAEIGAYAFKNSGLAAVTLNTGLVKIGDSAFYGIAGAEIVIPETVEVIGEYAFARSGLTKITFTGNAPAIGQGTFNKIVVEAFYPAANETWTEAVLQNYGGTVTWTAE